MADESPDKISFGIGAGRTRNLVLLADGSYADRTAPAAGAGLITEVTGQVMFDLGSLPCKPTYDADGNQTSITYGPDRKGRFVRQVSTWASGNRWMGDSAWNMVSGLDAP